MRRTYQSLSPELGKLAYELSEAAKQAGLDFFDTVFELVNHQELNAAAAYGGFPNRYPHWRWGMNYDRLAKTYRYGLSTIYELVINTDPAYAYLLDSNPLVLQKTVMAHVYGHVDFFKNNYWFSQTNRKMLDQMANNATTVRNIIEEVGQDQVEIFIDQCLSVDNLIDIHAPFKTPRPAATAEPVPQDQVLRPQKIKAKKYMDGYVNPVDLLEVQRQQQLEEAAKKKRLPEQPQRDVLQFMIDHAPLTEWQIRILQIIRDEAYYFAPQMQTKILNEGWASYWHAKMMTDLHPCDSAEIVDFCDLHSGVVAQHPHQVNPYRLGIELLRYAKQRWDEGKFGHEYVSYDDPKMRREHKVFTGRGDEKIFEIRQWHNDVTFVDEFLDEDFCHEHKMFLYQYDPSRQQNVITSRHFQTVKKELLDSITNLGQPIIELVDGNYKNRGEMLLEHRYTGKELKAEQSKQTLQALYRLWSRPVHISTYQHNKPVTWSFDGSDYEQVDTGAERRAS